MSSHHKQRELAKKRRLKRQRKKLRRSSFLPPEVGLLYDPPGVAKMSKVLDDFVEPYKESATTEAAMRKLLTVATVAWNAALLPPRQREEMIRKSEQAFPADARQDLRDIIEPMIARKLEQFAENQRAILGFELTMSPDGPVLNVMSSL